jgi:hypothetical protein
MQLRFDLGDYHRRFPEALQDKYESTFDEGFREVEKRFQAVRSGARDLSVDDVLAIFDESLPFVQDWTKPDRAELERKMNSRSRPVSTLVRELRSAEYNKQLITDVVNCFRELSLTALVLHHVYPDRFAMCSHHLASLLYITGETVPEFYIAYCRELRDWSRRKWATPGIQSVVDAEFALWTWYRLAFSSKGKRRAHQAQFDGDPWVQDRRAASIARALRTTDKLDLARSYLETDPTVAAIIAWRELEVAMRKVLSGKATRADKIRDLMRMLPEDAYPAGLTFRDLERLWQERNPVMHVGDDVGRERGERVVTTVAAFIRRSQRQVPRA